MAAVLCLPLVVLADEPKQKLDAKAQQTLDLLNARQKEAKELSSKATEVTVNIGKLAASGKLPNDDEAMKLMKQMVDELQGINARLKKIDEEIDGIKGWISGKDKTLPTLTKDVSDLKSTKVGGYVQFQYRDTDQRGGQTDSFRVRRAEMSIAHKLDSKTSLKVAFDIASNGFGTPNMPTDTSTTLKDAVLTYTPTPTLALNAGQIKMPLGYELERSSSEREFPEYALYNQFLFSGERGRGVNAVQKLGTNAMVEAGVWNALTYNDPEQRSFQGSQANRLGMSAGIKFYGKNYQFGVTGFAAERPAVQAGWNGGTQTKVNAPTIDRQFLFLDGSYTGLFLPGLFVRGEAMIGKDRLPLSPNSTSSGASNSGISDPNDVRLKQKDMAGFHAILGYNFNWRNTLLFKYEQFDPNLDLGGDFMRGYGAAYSYLINPNAKITLSHEIFEDASRLAVGSPARTQTRYGVTTLRVQFKF